MNSPHKTLRPEGRQFPRKWHPMAPPETSVIKQAEFKAEAERLAELRKKHEEWVAWTKEP